MEYGRLSGKLYAHEDWLGMSPWARELLVTLWSWAIDHEKEDGAIPGSVVFALSNSLGHGSQDHPMSAQSDAVKDIVAWGWADADDDLVSFTLRRWEEQAALLRKTRERREKERERYLRRKRKEDG